jgi:hypothetical protein
MRLAVPSTRVSKVRAVFSRVLKPPAASGSWISAGSAVGELAAAVGVE